MTPRQWWAALTAAIAAAVPLETVAADASYPSKPVKVVVGFSAGSATDVAARAISEAMAGRLGQPFVIDNKPGAASEIAAKAVVTSPPDGYTVFIATIANVINRGFPNSTSTDLVKDMVPVTMIGSVPNVLVVNPSLGVSSVADLIRLAKAKPGEITFASSGNGTSPHLSAEMFSSMAGVKMVHVPYKGSTPAMTDVLAGHVQVMFSPASTVLPHIKSGKVKALATTGAKRTSVVPDLPTVDEAGLKGFETSVWFGIVMPLRTPPDIVAKIQSAAHEALDSPQVQALFRAQGIDPIKSTPQEFARLIDGETTKWAKVIQTAGIKSE
jgi:tripartite-type tricarboxylate transporter receptor subunit TctC